MGTQQRSRGRNVVVRRLLSLLAVLALIATACGGASEESTASGDDSFGPLIEDEVFAPAADGDTDVDAETDAVDTDVDVVDASGSDQPAAEVLAFAIQAAEELSYSYEQGLLIDAELLGQRMVLGSDEPFVTGQVNGDDISVNADIGTFMLSMFESLGISANDPIFAGAFDGFGELEMDVWVVDDVVVMDLSAFANTIGDFDPGAANDLAIFADGPISIDIAQLEAFGGAAGSADAASIVGQFGQGAQVTDPADIVAALRNVDALVEAGVGTVNGVAVEVYAAEVAMSDYTEALDQDLTSALEQMGVAGQEFDTDALVTALESVVVDLTISIDDRGYVREIVTEIDMGAFADSMFAEMDDAIVGMEIDMVVETWQTFDNYGEDVDIVAPDAVDRTSELAGLLDS